MIAKCLIMKQAPIFEKEYTYHIPSNLLNQIKLYSLVIVEFGYVKYIAIVTNLEDTVCNDKKDILCAFPYNYINHDMIKLVNYLYDHSFNLYSSFLIKLIPRYLKPISRTKLTLVKETTDPFLLTFKRSRYLDNIEKEKLKIINKALKENILIKSQELYTPNIRKNYEIIFVSFNEQKSEKLNDFLLFLKSKKQINYYDLTEPYNIPLSSLKKIEKEGLIIINDVNYLNDLSILNNVINLNILPCYSFNLVRSTKLATTIYFLESLIYNAVSKSSQLLIIFNTIFDIKTYHKLFIEKKINTFCYSSFMTSSEEAHLFEYLTSDKPVVILATPDAIFLPITKPLAIVLVNPSLDCYTPLSPNFDAYLGFIELAKIKQIPLYNLGFTFNPLDYYHKDSYLDLDTSIDFNYTVIDLLNSINPNISTCISSIVIDKIKDNLTNNKKTLIVLDSLSFSKILVCQSCGSIRKCKVCNSKLSYYKSQNKLKCPSCKTVYDLDFPCSCSSKEFITVSSGLERIYHELSRIFSVDVTFFSSESKIDITSNLICSTSAIFNTTFICDINTLVYLDVDTYLNSYHYDAKYRLYRNIQYAKYLAANYSLKDLYLETYEAGNKFFSLIKKPYNYFYDYDLNLRLRYKYPPFSQYFSLKISSNDFNEVTKGANYILTVLSKSKSVTIVNKRILYEEKPSIILTISANLDVDLKKYYQRIKSIVCKVNCTIKVGVL